MLNVHLIKKTLRALGLTGKEVGDACGVTKEAAPNWLKGGSMPRPSKLIDLAALLKLPVEQLLGPLPRRARSPWWPTACATTAHRPSRPRRPATGSPDVCVNSCPSPTGKFKQRIGNIAASGQHGVVLEEIGPSFDDNAVADAQERLQARVSELYFEVHEEEFAYWRKYDKQRKAKP
jgi:transcriptional regulator with XRE-family HTH domain